MSWHVITRLGESDVFDPGLNSEEKRLAVGLARPTDVQCMRNETGGTGTSWSSPHAPIGEHGIRPRGGAVNWFIAARVEGRQPEPTGRWTPRARGAGGCRSVPHPGSPPG